ncbi:hypothetical protein V5O48_006120 [Marasmius crinis-equi]|uniref:Uncharacterized protein n=1 Tax=Marasmius crinis-equi TaxID=585013 RepID=A0ABR3FKD0_9AGAR
MRWGAHGSNAEQSEFGVDPDLDLELAMQHLRFLAALNILNPSNESVWGTKPHLTIAPDATVQRSGGTDGWDTAVWVEIEARTMKEWAQAMMDMSAWVTVEWAMTATEWAWEEELPLYALDASGQPVPNLSQRVEYLLEPPQCHQTFPNVAQMLESSCNGGRYPAARPVTQCLWNWGCSFFVQGQLPAPQVLKSNQKPLSYSSSQPLTLHVMMKLIVEASLNTRRQQHPPVLGALPPSVHLE